MNNADTGSGSLRRDMDISVKAGRTVGLLYEALLKRCKKKNDSETFRGLNVLCARLFFCLYADAAGLFGRPLRLRGYLRRCETGSLRGVLAHLFEILDTPPEKRAACLDETLAALPYVSSGLFSDKNIEIPDFDGELCGLLLVRAVSEVDWPELNPAVFSALFEATLNPAARRSDGIHYTSAENIHRVIDPLFLDDLKAELETAKTEKDPIRRIGRLRAFQSKLSGLVFFDPACGGGNFLTETYICLRRLENEALRLICGETTGLDSGVLNPVRVSVGQFYGIELDSLAAAVAKSALWLAERLMFRETEETVRFHPDLTPPKTCANIAAGSALRLDWEKVVPKDKLSYIIGNPPFVGYYLQSREQKADMLSVYADENGRPYSKAGKIDYAAAWYFKAAQLMSGSGVRAAFVSTNSITQGEQTAAVWKPLYERFKVRIDFACQTFKWSGESAQGAQVHCVIIGFSCAENQKLKRLFADGRSYAAENINFYLLDGDNIFIESRKAPICCVSAMSHGGKPVEGGFLILTEAEKDGLLKDEPQAAVFIRPFMMGKDFIDRKSRYCLWLHGVEAEALDNCPLVRERTERVREYRRRSPKAATRRKAETPMLFDEISECASGYIAMPKVSSGLRRYIPVDCLPPEVIPGDSLFFIPGVGMYELGILSSSMHMAWTRAFCGRLKSDYNYSNSVVYNNFPWPDPTEAQKAAVEEAARAILAARALYPQSSFAELYDDQIMPNELRRAHQLNDKAVMAAYGLSAGEAEESVCLAHLMGRYQKLTALT
ncbi:class I SAM-dependent DNA methyltransferase [bacterium]|nr:class I SAM-dependent DNA methyltransferase [bacterium]